MHRPRRRPLPPPTHRPGAGGSRGAPRVRARVGVRHAAAAHGRGGPARRGARGTLPSALSISLAAELVWGRHRPRRRPLPPPTHCWGRGFAGRPENAGSRLSSPCRCAEAGGGLSRDEAQVRWPPRACVARGFASARPLHGGSSASRSRLRGCAALRSAYARLGCPSPNVGFRLYWRGAKCLKRLPLVCAWSCPRTRTEVD